MFQVKMRAKCADCEGKDANCLLCDGTGWIEFWSDLVVLARAVNSDNPEAAVALSRIGDNLALYQEKVEERARKATS